MPNRDGTGPMGMGPRTGRGLGPFKKMKVRGVANVAFNMLDKQTKKQKKNKYKATSFGELW